MSTNDNYTNRSGASSLLGDAQGQAALLLVESLIHGLCERAMLTASHSVEIVERAMHVQYDLAEQADGAGAAMWRSHELLEAIAASLRVDCDDTPPPPRLVT